MKKISLGELAGIFLKLGATSFDGAMLPLMEDMVVHHRKCLDSTEFTEIIALAELVPGPVAIKVAAYSGYLLRGFPGLVVAEFFFMLPSVALALTGSVLLFRYGRPISLQHLSAFLSPIMVATFVIPTFRLGQKFVTRPIHGILAVGAFAAMRMKISPLWIFLICGLLGILYSSLRGHGPKPS